MDKKQFTFRCMVYKEKDKTFTGACLDLDIVEEGHETLEEARLSLNDALESHMQATAKLGFPKELTNRPAPKEYWDKLQKITDKTITRPIIDQLELVTVTSTGSTLCYA